MNDFLTSNPAPELTDEQITEQLTGAATAPRSQNAPQGPRTFRGRILADMKRGLQNILTKSHQAGCGEDTLEFGAAACIFVLLEAFSHDGAERLQKRYTLQTLEADIHSFRTKVSLFLDELNEGEVQDAIRIAKEISEEIEAARVQIDNTGKKKDVGAEPSPISTPSISGTSPAPLAGA